MASRDFASRRQFLGSVALLLGGLWGAGLGLIGLVILLFPDGKLSSAGWRWVLRAYVLLYAFSVARTGVITAGVIIGHRISVPSTGGLAPVDHPAGWYRADAGPRSPPPRGVQPVLHRPSDCQMAALVR